MSHLKTKVRTITYCWICNDSDDEDLSFCTALKCLLKYYVENVTNIYVKI